MILAAAKDMLPRSMDCDQEDLREEENQELFVQRCDYRSLMGLKMSDFSLHWRTCWIALASLALRSCCLLWRRACVASAWAVRQKCVRPETKAVHRWNQKSWIMKYHESWVLFWILFFLQQSRKYINTWWKRDTSKTPSPWFHTLYHRGVSNGINRVLIDTVCICYYCPLKTNICVRIVYKRWKERYCSFPLSMLWMLWWFDWPLLRRRWSRIKCLIRWRWHVLISKTSEFPPYI